MWHLKYRYSHSDCIYVPKLLEYGLSVQFFHIGRYTEGRYVFTTAIQKLAGETAGIGKYFSYLQAHRKITKAEILSGNSIMTQARHMKEIMLYESVYDPAFIHPAPAYMEKDGHEVIELICWEKKPLQDHIRIMERSSKTTYFELLRFQERRLDDIYALRLLPILPEQQEKAIRLAFSEGYYEYPRRISLTRLADIAGVSKPTFRENLKKAESKLMPHLISGP